MDRSRLPDQVILVDESDRPLGAAQKLAAHENGGRLHRAFSVFIFNSAGQMLLQRRSARKYHFGGLWTNACCSHPRPGESLAEAAVARLREEFGFDADLRVAFSFTYREVDPASGLTEHEFDHVFIGRFDGHPLPNPEEIDDWKWVHTQALAKDVRDNSAHYTPWFRIALERVLPMAPSPSDVDLTSPAPSPFGRGPG